MAVRFMKGMWYLDVYLGGKRIRRAISHDEQKARRIGDWIVKLKGEGKEDEALMAVKGFVGERVG